MRPAFKKTESTNTTDTKAMKSILDRRGSMRRGIVMVQDLLKRNNSKLTVYLCCFIMRKVKGKAVELDKEVKAFLADK